MRDDDLVTLQLVGDFSYAWEIIDCFTLDMQEGVKKDPTTLGKLRAMFLKVNKYQTLNSELISYKKLFSLYLVSICP